MNNEKKIEENGEDSSEILNLTEENKVKKDNHYVLEIDDLVISHNAAFK